MKATQLPLHDLGAKTLSEVFGKMTPAQVVAFLGGEAPPTEGLTPSPSEIGNAVLDMTLTGNRLRYIEEIIVRLALDRTKGNVSAAARLLGIERKAMERRLDRHKIRPER